MSLTTIYLTAVGGALAIFALVLLRRWVWLAVVPPVVAFFVYILVHNFRLHPCRAKSAGRRSAAG
jgi:hypothetical protein